MLRQGRASGAQGPSIGTGAQVGETACAPDGRFGTHSTSRSPQMKALLRTQRGLAARFGRVAVTVGAACGAAIGCGPTGFIDVPPEMAMCLAPDGVIDGLHPAVQKTLPFVPRQLVGDRSTPGASSHGMARVGDRLLVADPDNGALAIVDEKTLQPLASLALGGRPEQIVVAADGVAYVSLRHSGAVARIDAAELKATATWQVGAEPIGLALTPDGKTLMVALAGESKVAFVDTKSGATLKSVAMAGEPRSLTLRQVPAAKSGSGQPLMLELVVAFAHGSPSTLVLTQSENALLVGQQGQIALRKRNPAMDENGPELRSWRSIATTVEPESGDVLAVHVLASPGNESAMLQSMFNKPMADGSGGSSGASSDGYGSSGPACSPGTPIRPIEVSVSRLQSTSTVETREFAIADPQSGRNFLARFDQPHDIVHHPAATMAFVAAFGTDNVLVLNTGIGDPMLAPIAELKVGQAPRALALSADGKKLFVHNAHGFSVSEVDLQPLLDLVVAAYPKASAGSPPPQLAAGPLTLVANREVAFASDPLTGEARLGRRIFTFTHNDKIAAAGRFACASCHLEGDEDKLTWFVADGPRQTPTLAGRLLGTGPFNWGGTEEGLQSNMDKTIERMGGHGLVKGELAALESFLLTGLPERPNPNRAATGLTEAQERGRKLFKDPVVACASCHTGDGLTDGRNWDVGTASSAEVEARAVLAMQTGTKPTAVTFNTPSLRGLWHTGPYLHDGSADSIEQLLKRTDGAMGKTSHLTKSELADLVAYLKTL